jgi:hypothetical protein
MGHLMSRLSLQCDVPFLLCHGRAELMYLSEQGSGNPWISCIKHAHSLMSTSVH